MSKLIRRAPKIFLSGATAAAPSTLILAALAKRSASAASTTCNNSGNMLYQDVIQHILSFLSPHSYCMAASINTKWYHAAQRHRSLGWEVQPKARMIGFATHTVLDNIMQSSLRHHITSLLLHGDSTQFVLTLDELRAIATSMQQLRKLRCTLSIPDEQHSAQADGILFPPQLCELHILPKQSVSRSVDSACASFTTFIHAIASLQQLKTLTIVCVAYYKLQAEVSLLQPLQQLQLLESFALSSRESCLVGHKSEHWNWITHLPKLSALYWNQFKIVDMKYLSTQSVCTANLTDINHGRFDIISGYWPYLKCFRSLSVLDTEYGSKAERESRLHDFGALTSLCLRCSNNDEYDLNIIASDLVPCGHSLLSFDFQTHDRLLTTPIMGNVLQHLQRLTTLSITSSTLADVSFLCDLPHLHSHLTSLTLKQCRLMEADFFSSIIYMKALKQLRLTRCFAIPVSEDAKLHLTPSSPTRLPQLVNLTSFVLD